MRDATRRPILAPVNVDIGRFLRDWTAAHQIVRKRPENQSNRPGCELAASASAGGVRPRCVHAVAVSKRPREVRYLEALPAVDRYLLSGNIAL